MTSNFSKYISEQIDDNTHIMWFEKSNKYIVVNDLLNNLILNKIDDVKFPINASLLKQSDYKYPKRIYFYNLQILLSFQRALMRVKID